MIHMITHEEIITPRESTETTVTLASIEETSGIVITGENTTAAHTMEMTGGEHLMVNT